TGYPARRRAAPSTVPTRPAPMIPTRGGSVQAAALVMIQSLTEVPVEQIMRVRTARPPVMWGLSPLTNPDSPYRRRAARIRRTVAPAARRTPQVEPWMRTARRRAGLRRAPNVAVMLRTTLAGLRAHARRLSATVIAVVLGVGFCAG